MTKPALTPHQRAVLLAAAHNAKLTAWPLPRQLQLSKGSATIVAKGLLKKAYVEERKALGNDPIWREDTDGKPLALVISNAGLAAVDMLPEERPTRKRGSASVDNPESNTASADKSAAAANPDSQWRMPRAGTKLAMLVGLLEREGGATVEEMSAATGWAQHTARGVLSGVLKKRFGLQIGSQKIVGRGRVYRVEGGSARGSDEVGSTGQ